MSFDLLISKTTKYEIWNGFKINGVKLRLKKPRLHSRAVVSGGAGGALASPEFGSSVNPIPTRGGRLCPPHYC